MGQKPIWTRQLPDAFVSKQDLAELIAVAIEHEPVDFLLLHGISDNVYKRMDLASTRSEVGYQPRHDFAQENRALSN